MGARRWKIIGEITEHIQDEVLRYTAELGRFQENVGPLPKIPFPSLWALAEQVEKFHTLPESGGLNDQFYMQMVCLIAFMNVMEFSKAQRQLNKQG